MTEVVKLALIGATPLTLTAIGGIWIGLRSSRKLDTIHDVTNHNWSELKGELKVAQTEIVGLKNLIGQMGDKRGK